MFTHAATSEGYVHNAFKRDFTSKTIYELVAEKNLTWCTYFHDHSEVLQFKQLGTSPDRPGDGIERRGRRRLIRETSPLTL
jgi:hypothetical protein